jgi:tRNA 5-methylaminomethyl-2-thiouridine biosynthesis bifunctional protein
MNQNQAQLEWRQGQPYASQYDDVYFSSDNGLEETEYVFLKHNQLAIRWQQLDSDVFTIAETGFGTGLNFLCAWQLWRQNAPEGARLHFVSTEKFPLTQADLAKALSLWLNLKSLSEALLEQYLNIREGFHRLVFDDGRVTLSLLIGDANKTLPQLNAQVDAWFLDGFAPAKNPDMWLPALFQQMARLSHKETTFATFTSAGEVKRGLQSVGFEVKKASGFGKKREMLFGQFCSEVPKAKTFAQKKAIVIGGGLAGTSSAQALARRGWQVTLIERHAQLAQEGSGNPLGVLYPRLIGGGTSINQLALQGFLYSLRLLHHLNLRAEDYDQCGVLQLAFNAREQQRLNKINSEYPDLIHEVNKNIASDLSGIKLDLGGAFIPQAGWVDPAALCAALSNHHNIQIKYQTEAISLKYIDQRHKSVWQVWSEESCVAEAPVVIIASANDTQNFTQTQHCELSAVRGQISLLPATEQSQSIKTVICTDGYLSPAKDALHCLGATFTPNDSNIDERAHDHQSNLKQLKTLAPRLAETYNNTEITGRAALRCVTSDYLPLAGPVLDLAQLNQTPPRYNTPAGQLPWLDGLYVNTGHGAKGLVNAPICAEAIASLICNEPSPVSNALLSALDPNRFALKQMGLKRLAQTIQSQSLAKK